MSAASWHEYETLEASYWSFDSLRAGQGRFGPMAERDAFKAAARALMAVERERWARWHVTQADIIKAKCNRFDWSNEEVASFNRDIRRHLESAAAMRAWETP